MIFIRSPLISLLPTGQFLNFLSCFGKTWKAHISFSSDLAFDSLFKSTHKLLDVFSERNGPTQKSNSSLRYDIPHEHCAEFEVPGQIFGEIIRNKPHSIFEWTATISCLAKSDRQEEAIGLFKVMLQNDQRPNYVTVLSLIRAVGTLGSEDMIRGIHGFVIKLGFEIELSIVTALLGLYSLHDMVIARQLFDPIPVKDLVLWSAMVTACSKNRQFVEAIEIFRKMQYAGVEPNHVSIVSILPACGNLGALSLGKEIHGYSFKRVFSSLTNVQNSLVDMYAKCRNLEVSVLIFNRIVHKDIVSWNTIICGFIENGFPRKALNLFINMVSSCVKPNEITVRNVLVACSQSEQFKFGLGLHCFVLKSGLLAFVSIGTSLLRMYADFGKVGLAAVLFTHLHHKDLIAWSAMIAIYSRAGYSICAVDTFKQMQLANMKPNKITLVSLVQACASLGAQEPGKSIHAHVIRVGYSSNGYIMSALIDFYCKFGKLSEGKTLFDRLPTKDLICWSSMIHGYGINGCGIEALDTFSKMLQCGTKPNDIVFISVLSACAHCGLIDEGWGWFSSMEEKYGITPTLPHYACMVDLLSRRGYIEEALQFVYRMPVEPDANIWGALLSGCRSSQGPIEVVEFAAKRLLSLDPQNTSYHVILSNLYAEHGRWRDAERLWGLVKEKGLKKTVGYSMVEAK